MGIAPFARQLSNNNLKFQTKYGDSKAKFDARPLQLEYYNIIKTRRGGDDHPQSEAKQKKTKLTQE